MARSAGRDELLDVIGQIYAAGRADVGWPDALKAVTGLVGGIAATLEVFDRKAPALVEFHSFGLPPANELAYLDHYARLNPRIPALINGEPGTLVTDYTVLDESEMSRNEFYEEFLAPVGYRYFVGGILSVGDRESTLFSVQRATRQGHVEPNSTERMLALLPHVRGAFDVARRLRSAARRTSAFEDSLDWLADGAALLCKNGRMIYTNDAFDAIVACNDGLRIAKGMIEFRAPQAQARFVAALAAIGRLGGGNSGATGHTDFLAARAMDAPAYVVSLRPLMGTRSSRHSDAIAVIFVRDPLDRNPAAARMLRELYGFTAAEANLALAMQAGVSLPEYARQTGVSLNTIYTHLRRIKDKSGFRRLSDLTRRLNDLRVPLA
jgi:DNA-binding CsgD family transcriptional regulator